MIEYINREALLAQLKEKASYNVSPMYRRGYDDCAATVLNAAAADVAPVVHGRWLQVDSTKCRCSQCDIIAFIALYPHGDKSFCPNCGAKMDGGADND